MNPFNSWLGKKKASLCILAGLCAVSLCVIMYAGEKIDAGGGGSYAIRIRHYGVDAAGMERDVSMPLEDALSAIPGVRSVQSTSENSLSRVFVRFGGGGKGQYEAVREAAQRIYETLPASAQRPEIQSSDDSRAPVWSAAVFPVEGNSADTAFFLERAVKPRLESLEGAGEVLISGTGLQEIVITLDQEKLAALGLEPFAVASALGMNDGLFSGGAFTERGREIIVTVDGRYDHAAALGGALIPLGGGGAAELSTVAHIELQERQPDTLSRLNGKKAAVVAVMAGSPADLRKLSRNIAKELAALPEGWEFTVLADRGAGEAAAFRSVLSAALQGAFMVALISFFLNIKKAHNAAPNYAGVFCALAVPAICLVSAAALALCGFPPDRIVLAGIAAGIGGAIDPVILCTEKLRRCKNIHDAAAGLKQLRGPLAAGAITTAAALLPLSTMDGGVKAVACAIGAVTVIALVISMTLLPPLLLWSRRAVQLRLPKRILFLPGRLRPALRFFLRRLCRFLAVNVKFCVRYPLFVIASGAALAAAAVVMLVIRGADSGSVISHNTVYAQVEFEGGLLAEETDRLLAEYGEKLAGFEGIRNVETGAKTGSGTLLVSFDPAGIQSGQVRKLIRETPIPGGFVFLPESGSNESHWFIKIFGDDGQKCRELAEQLARSCAGLPLIKERVLNFKEGSKKLIMIPDRAPLAALGIQFSQSADAARMGVFAPVAYKRTGNTGEIDVRIGIAGGPGTASAAGNVTRHSISGEQIPGLLAAYGKTGGGVRLDSVMRNTDSMESAGIRREDRRRTASITISTGRMDPRRVKKELAGILGGLDLPPGYSVEFDPEAVQQAEALSGTVFSLLAAIVFCYMVIAAVNESFTVPLAVLAAVPPSLALPALCLAINGNPFNPAASCALVAVSGMTVNAAVLCAAGMDSAFLPGQSECRMSLYRTLRRKMPALFATAGTTVAGAIPFLFLREGENVLARTLSLVGALGVAASCFCAISVVPAFILILRKIFVPISHQTNFPLVREQKSISGNVS